MKKILLLLSIWAQWSLGQSPLDIPAIHSRSFKPGNADAMILLAQPASVSRLKTFSGAVYNERKFLLKELNTSMASIGLPISFGGLGLTIRHYNYNSAGIIYGKNLGKLDLGLRFSYSDRNLIGYEIGTIWQISDRISSAMLLSKEERNVYRFGLGYKTSDAVFVSVEFIKEEERQININVGIYYSIGKKIFLQGGIQTEIASPFWCASYQLSKMRLESYCSYHPQLGFSPGLSLIFQSK